MQHDRTTRRSCRAPAHRCVASPRKASGGRASRQVPRKLTQSGIVPPRRNFSSSTLEQMRNICKSDNRATFCLSRKTSSRVFLDSGGRLRQDRQGLLAKRGCMKTTRYFEEQVLRVRPYIEPAWCLSVVAAPLRRESQRDGRIRHRGIDPSSRVEHRRRRRSEPPTLAGTRAIVRSFLPGAAKPSGFRPALDCFPPRFARSLWLALAMTVERPSRTATNRIRHSISLTSRIGVE
jgi:hypothetical protein